MKFLYPLLLDGATGSNLIAAGMKPGERTADFILEKPDVLIDLQRRYIEAGSVVIPAPTFGVNPVKYGKDFADILKRLIAITRNTVEKYGNGKVFTASDMSPCGLFAEPMGTASFDDIYNSFAAQVKVYVEEDIDILSFMTMYSLSEARIALLACRELSDKPVFASVTVDKRGKTMTGSDICACVSLLGNMGASAAGLNCSTGPSDTLDNIKRAAEAAVVPLYCKPNAGTDVENYLSPDLFASEMMKIAKEGATLLGGCCGTTPEHIAELNKALCEINPDEIKNIAASRWIKLEKTRAISVTTEKSYRELPQIRLGEASDVETFLDEYSDFDFDEADAAHLEINTLSEAQELLSSAFMFDIPLAVSCEDYAVAEKLAREYCGQLVFTDRCDFEPEQKSALSSLYASIFI